MQGQLIVFSLRAFAFKLVYILTYLSVFSYILGFAEHNNSNKMRRRNGDKSATFTNTYAYGNGTEDDFTHSESYTTPQDKKH